MALTTLKHMHVRGISAVVPSNEKCIDDDAGKYAGGAASVERIKATIGIDRRRVAPSHVTTADLCCFAAERLLDAHNLDKESIDAIICVTQTPDYWLPCNAAVLHGKMKFPKSCACFDVSMGCSGYVYGLWLAGMMVESGGLKRVLLLVGDTVSKFVNPKDLTAAALFGDAGSATLVEYQEEAEPSFFSLKTDGSGYEALIIPAGGYRNPRNEENSQEKQDADGNWRSDCDLYMNGGDVFNFTIREEPKAVFEILEYAHVDKDDIDYYFFHQANRYILSNITKRIKVPVEKVPCDLVSQYGNQSSASIPVAVAETVPGKSNPLRVLMSGFGVGLSWASVVLSLDPSVVLPLADYPDEVVTL